MMPPKARTAHEEGLLEYLEDIIGTDKYVESIETKFTEVEALGAERQTKLNKYKAAVTRPQPRIIKELAGPSISSSCGPTPSNCFNPPYLDPMPAAITNNVISIFYTSFIFIVPISEFTI